jgi:transcriptional regulator with XRE-family HTH domain
MSAPRSTILITPRLCKAARALLDWTAADLAEYSGVGVTTVRIYESEARGISRLMLVALERTFSDAGIDFLPDGIRVRELEAA